MRLSKYAAEGVHMPSGLSAKYGEGRHHCGEALDSQDSISNHSAHLWEAGGRGTEWVGEAQVHL